MKQDPITDVQIFHLMQHVLWFKFLYYAIVFVTKLQRLCNLDNYMFHVETGVIGTGCVHISPLCNHNQLSVQ